ncbi:MAG: hypothetical protein K6F21_06670, partial [Bacteroidales bacterium]|nr:hypothetical protein [Bacteroidales bacterium]
LCCPDAHPGPRVENHRPDLPSDFYRHGDQSFIDRYMQRVRKIMLQYRLAEAYELAVSREQAQNNYAKQVSDAKSHGDQKLSV